MVARPRGKPFTVDTRPTKIALVNSLTRDISVEACVFDLIDNAVDAARESIFAKSEDLSSATLPESYSGYEIRLSFSGERFCIADNCGGISVEDLQQTALRFGERSTHPLGIGIFGLGLNRALFKIGKVGNIHSDTGRQRSELVLNTENYLQTTDTWDIPAKEFKSSGHIGTIVEIVQLHNEIAQNFGDTTWVENYRKEISRRYGRFIRKGLIIDVNEIPAEDGEIHIREDGPFKDEYKFYVLDGVSVYFQVGQHEQHRFSAEPSYEKSSNAQLTLQYGWTILCNDRAVIMADRSWKTGWDAKFHTEFYGFVGVVNFVSDSPSLLPWDTTKSDVDLNNRAYQVALNDMRKFAQKWRQFATQAKVLKRKDVPLLPLPDAGPAPVPTPAGGVGISPAANPAPIPKPLPKETPRSDAGVTGGRKPKAIIKPDHNQFASILPKDVSERYCDDKHLALVHEAKTFNLRDFPYAGMALIRILFEVSAVKFFDRLGLAGEVQRFVIAERQKKNFTVRDPISMTVSADEYITYMETHPEIWGTLKAGHLKQALRNMAARKKLLNGVVHNPYQSINGSEAFAIRDEVLPILRHLIQADPPS